MKPQKKFWFVLASSMLALVAIACSCGSLTSLTTPTPTAQVVIPPTVQPQIAEYDFLPYYDDFTDAASGWDIFDTEGDSVGYGSGYYYVISRTTDYISYGSANKHFADTVIDLDITLVSGPDTMYTSMSVACRVQETDDAYLFEITGDGYYAVGYFANDGNEYVSLTGSEEWMQTDAVNQGAATNHLTVICDGSRLAFSINGVMVFDGTDYTYSEGDIGLGAATYDPNVPLEVHFENLMVTAP